MKELIAIQNKLKAPKGNYNSFGKYKYRSCEDILESVKPLLSEQGCTLTMTDDIVMVGDRIYVKAIATLTASNGDHVSTTAFAREEDQKKGMDGSQITGTASSYARKYALNGLFCIDDTKDADALNTSKEYTKKTTTDDELEDMYQTCKVYIEQARSKDELRGIIAQWPALKSYPKFTSHINERWKEVA